MSVWEELWEEGDFWGGGRVLKKMRQAGWPGRAVPMQVGVEESLSCLYLSFPAAVGPLLLHSGPVSAAVARALLLLSAQGRKEKGRLIAVCLSGTGWVPEPLS